MPYRPPSICPHCRRLVAAGVRCPCLPPPSRRPDPGKADRWRPYASKEWRTLRAEHLFRQCSCVACGAPGAIVDHIQPWRGDKTKFLDPQNLQTMCKRCHDRKTASKDGGFGNKKRP